MIFNKKKREEKQKAGNQKFNNLEKGILCISILALILAVYGIFLQVSPRKEMETSQQQSDLEVGTEFESVTEMGNVTSAETMIMGDINGDGQVTLVDAQMLLDAYNHVIELDERQSESGKVLGREYYDLRDVYEVLNIAIKKE